MPPLRGPRKSVDFWGVDRLGGALASKGGGHRNTLPLYLNVMLF